MSVTTKFKCLISFVTLKTDKELKCLIELYEHFLSINLPDINKTKKDIIKNIFAPIHINNLNNTLSINYSLIKTIQSSTQDPHGITIIIYNPILKVDLTFTLRKPETLGLLIKRKIPIETIHKIILVIQQKVPKETKYLIQRFLLLLSLLKDCLDPQKAENQQIENILLQAYLTGKNYYEKYTNEYKNNLRIKNGIKKQLNEKLKMFESMLSEQEQVKRNLACACFDSLLNEFKSRTSGAIEESIVVFFQILSVENNMIDFKKLDKIAVSTNLRTIKDDYLMRNSSITPQSNNKNSININNSKNHHINNMNININVNVNSFPIPGIINPHSNGNSLNLSQNQSQDNNNSGVNPMRMNKSYNALFHSKNVEALAQLNISDQDCIITNNSNINNLSNVPNTQDIAVMNNINMIFNENITISTSIKDTTKKPKEKSKPKYQFDMNTKDLLETPKFYSNNNKQYNSKYINKKNGINNNADGNANHYRRRDDGMSSGERDGKQNEEETISMPEIMKQIEQLIKAHSYVPPVDVFNIFVNTSEIIHRKFFELCFETFLGRIFSYETDNDNLIKIDSLYNYFLHLRGMKNYIFSEKNKIYFSSMLFIADDLK